MSVPTTRLLVFVECCGLFLANCMMMLTAIHGVQSQFFLAKPRRGELSRLVIVPVCSNLCEPLIKILGCNLLETHPTPCANLTQQMQILNRYYNNPHTLVWRRPCFRLSDDCHRRSVSTFLLSFPQTRNPLHIVQNSSVLFFFSFFFFVFVFDLFVGRCALSIHYENSMWGKCEEKVRKFPHIFHTISSHFPHFFLTKISSQ